MRTDIVLNTELSELELGDTNTSPIPVLGKFMSTSGEFDLYEVDISSSNTFNDLVTGIFAVLPINISTNNIKVNFRYRYGFTDTIKETGYVLFENVSGVNLKSSDLQRYINNPEQTGSVMLFVAYDDSTKKCVLYAGENIDLTVGESLNQNKDLILKASKSNIYQSQTIGVGLIDFLNSDLTDTKIINEVIENFAIDGMKVVSMSVNNDTGYISLEAKEVKP